MSPGFHRQALRGLKLSGTGLIFASLGWQLVPLVQLSTASAVSAPLSQTTQSTAPLATPTALQQLFGTPDTPPVPAPEHATLRLLACFAGSTSRQSSALLSLNGQPARRVRIGEQMAPGLQVTAIQAQSIDVSRHGRPYTLRLHHREQAAHSIATPTLTAAPR
jgi:hypothetical protein